MGTELSPKWIALSEGFLPAAKHTISALGLAIR